MNDQDFGQHPLEIRNTSHYKSEYSPGFADHWDQVANWDIRDAYEKSYYINLLSNYACEDILDVATGTGYHSIQFIANGFNVTSLDGSSTMLAKAVSNSLARNILLETIHCDWLDIPSKLNGRNFDAIVCLGNSFTHVFDPDERINILKNFCSVLKEDGLLVIDHRNYSSLINGMPTRKAQYYAGKSTSAEPEYLDEGLARYRYTFSDGSYYFLNMFPITSNTLISEAQTAGFQLLQTLFDLSDKQTDEAAFIQHVFRRVSFE